MRSSYLLVSSCLFLPTIACDPAQEMDTQMRTSAAGPSAAMHTNPIEAREPATSETTYKTPKKKKPKPIHPVPKPKPKPQLPPLDSTCGADPTFPGSQAPQFDTRRWIGIKGSAFACSDYNEPHWTVTPLFSAPAFPGATVPLGLEKYCLVEADPVLYVPGMPLPVPEGKTAGLLDLEKDAPIFAAESQLSQIAFPSMRSTFLAGAGYLPSPDATIPGTPDARVDVVVLDTTPDDGGAALRSPHGISLYGMVDELMCGTQTSCQRRTRMELAMGRYYASDTDANFDFDFPYASHIDPVRGGNFGTQGELAVATLNAIARFESSLNSNQDDGADRLVLNMSLGWDPNYFGDFPLSSSSTAAQIAVLNNDTTSAGVAAPVRAVHAMLTYANCAGAVSVASTGNRIPGFCDGGPLFPAAFNQFPRLDENECKLAGLTATFLDPSFPAHGAAPSPMVYGVGGTNWSGQTGAFQRPDATPELNALGFKGAAYTDNASSHSGILTGTSVSSAVAAASIATAWSYHGAIPGGELVEKITGLLSPIAVPTGTGLPVTDYALTTGPGGPPILARNIELCGAVSAANDAFSGGAFVCPSTTVATPDFATTLDDGIITTGLSVDLEDSYPLPETACSDGCGNDYIFMETLGSNWHNGPLVQGNFIMPQPHSGLCPACNINGSGSNGGGTSSAVPTGTATIALDDAYHHLHPGRVTVVRSGPGQPDVYIDLGEILNPSDMSAITVVESPALADDPISSGYNSATIVVELRDPTTSFEFNGTDALVTE